MKLQAEWLDRPGARQVCAMLTDGGFQALFVGGCIRNELLGEPVADIDIATDALPRSILDLAKAAGIKAVPTGIDHGTITLVCMGNAYEVTTFRQDVETDGRHAKVAFSSSLQDDARRRDFTMNALYALPDGTIVDPLDAMADVMARRLRFIDDADARIREDYLRILRYFRLQAWYGSEPMDPAALAACAENRSGVASLSRERVTAEVTRLLAAPDPTRAAQAMSDCAILDMVLPGSRPQGLPALIRVEAAANTPPRWQRRLAALGGNSASLRLSRREIRELADVQAARSAKGSPAQLAQRFGSDAARDAILVACAERGETPPPGLEQALLAGAASVFPLSAADFDLAGPDLGRALTRARKTWIDSGMTLSREQLLSDVGRAR
jgi:poly(A) polymerase